MFGSVPSSAQDGVQVQQSTPPPGSTEAVPEVKTLPNLSAQESWPEPTADNAKYTSFLSDLLEGQRIAGVNALRWDFLGWYGGDTRRLWFRSEGAVYPSRDPGGEADVQVLYGKLISPFFDLQVGGRVEQHYERGTRPVRVFAVLGLQGLSPGRFEVEPSLFVSNNGKVSGRFTASVDLYQTQRLVLQPRFETEVAVQRDEEFGVERGVSDAEVGLRLRYEIRREYAPYVGVSYRQSFGATRERFRREGGRPNEVQFVFGVRTWL
ncbi:MAG: copper resistance protein B [Cyanobacteria bacterium]|nr:copper resistance protein B [Cyanobacteriota bacterium]